MKEITYTTTGTCSKAIRIMLEDDNTVSNVQFIGGCPGNTQGVATLVKGMKAEDVIEKLQGIQCGNRGTSCPDQLSKALIKAQ